MSLYELVKAKCKFCGREIVLKVDPDYAEIGDPYKLLPRGSCNHCADLHERQRRLIDGLKYIAENALRGGKREELEGPARKLLTAYFRLVGDWLKLRESLTWDETVVEAFFQAPDKLGKTLSLIWKTGRDLERQKSLFQNQ